MKPELEKTKICVAERMIKLTFLQGDQGWHVIWNVILPFLCVSGSRLGKLQHIVFANRKEWHLMGESHRLHVVDIVLQFTETDSHEPEGLVKIIKHWVCSSICNAE